MITFYTVMSKNAEPEIIAREAASLPNALRMARADNSGQAIILTRVAQGYSCDKWREAAADNGLSQWQVFPLAGAEEAPEATPELDVTPFREVAGALTPAMFGNLLKRELMRLGRNGGSLSLVCASLYEKKDLATALGATTTSKLERLLGAVLLKSLDACDGLGLLRQGQYICSLPGLGQLAARHFAEKAQSAFEEAARPYFPVGGISAGKGIFCALGIVNILQGETGSVDDLIRRARTALEVALTRDGAHIHQETASMPLENTTLVQSSEKRFLFFGGDPA